MCKVSTPKYEKPPEYSRPLEPDNTALYDEAMSRAAMRGGGTTRSTILSGLQSTAKPPTAGQSSVRPGTVLG